MKFETIHSEQMYQGRAFSVRQDRVRLPNEGETKLDIVEHVGAVTIMPIGENGNVWFVRQYRHAIGIEILELPAGTLEPGEPPEVCAERETREEIGMGAKKFQKIGAFYMAPGYSTEFMHVYLATNLFDAPLPGDKEGIKHDSNRQVHRWQNAGGVPTGKTIFRRTTLPLTTHKNHLIDTHV